VMHDGAALSTGELDKIHNKHTIRLRTPTNSELQKVKRGKTLSAKPSDGCTVIGRLRIPIVAGSLGISLKKQTWAEATTTLSMALHDAGASERLGDRMQHYNVSHYIHHIRFGDPFPLAAAKPLEDHVHIIENNFGGIALEQVVVKLVPTLQQGFLSNQRTYQMSVVDHTVQPQTLVAHGVPHLPGIVVVYDFTPLAVHHSGGRENFLVFLSSLLSIVGGVFVTVGLVSSCLFNSAAVVAKKID